VLQVSINWEQIDPKILSIYGY